MLVALGVGAVAEAQSPQCAAGERLLAAGLLDDAKQRFHKALDEDGAGRECGVTGLENVAAAEAETAKEKEDDKNTFTFAEAWEDVENFVTQGVPWIVVVLVVWAVLLVRYALRKDKRVHVHAPTSSEDLAKRVVAAARAAGGKHAAPVKIITASDEPGDTRGADLAKLLRIPGTVPIGDLLKRPPFSGWISIRLNVSGAIAGGWAVIELTFREPLSRKRSERIAIELGDIDDAEKTEVLALVGGAWLNVVLQTDGVAPVRNCDAAGMTDHALFRAGANRQALGKTQIARACYAARRDVSPDIAPFAWAGSRLNEMMALKTERRWLEATQVANEVGDFPAEVINDAERESFGPDEMAELLLRQRYMTAILRVDHWYAVYQQPNTFSPNVVELKQTARSAVDRLDELVRPERGASRKFEPLRAAGRMVVLSYAIASGQGGGIEDVRKQLGIGTVADSKRPAVAAAGYYDAACAVSLLLTRSVGGDGTREKRIREGLWLLETAVAATLETRRPRVREMARTDPMLEHLEQAEPAGFAKALGEPPPEDRRSATGGEAIANTVAAIADG